MCAMWQRHWVIPNAAYPSASHQTFGPDFAMEGGYVLQFSDRTMREFFANDLNIDIYDPWYAVDGTSKGKRVRCFLRLVDAPTAIRVLHALWKQRQGFYALDGRPDDMLVDAGQNP